MVFGVYVFAWLPYASIPNLLWDVPAGAAPAATAAAGPLFAGDRFVVPPLALEGMRHRSVRAWQGVEIPVNEWGQPAGTGGGPVQACPLHVLHADGATRVQTADAIVTRSALRVGYNPVRDAYEVSLEGEATIPFLVEAAAAAESPQGGGPEGPVPAVGWQLHLAIGMGKSAADSARVGPGCDESGRFFAGVQTLGGEDRNHVHGHIAIRFFPSYVVYVSLRRPEGGTYSAPVFFANGFGRKITGILCWTPSPLRPLSW